MGQSAMTDQPDSRTRELLLAIVEAVEHPAPLLEVLTGCEDFRPRGPDAR